MPTVNPHLCPCPHLWPLLCVQPCLPGCGPSHACSPSFLAVVPPMPVAPPMPAALPTLLWPLPCLWPRPCLQPLCTLLWHTLNTPLLMMLHCFSAQERRCGFRLQGSGLWLTSGQVEASFQLFPKSSSLVTTMWSRVVKSFLVWSSKFPHRPHTVPCRKKDKSLQLEKILR